MKQFQIPINDERAQTITEEQIDFMLWSNILDDPEKVRRLDNYFYDPEYDKEFNEVSNEDASGTVDRAVNSEAETGQDEYDPAVPLLSDSDNMSDVDDWEEV